MRAAIIWNGSREHGTQKTSCVPYNIELFSCANWKKPGRIRRITYDFALAIKKQLYFIVYRNRQRILCTFLLCMSMRNSEKIV